VDERQLLDALCDVRPEWRARRDAIHRSGLYYVDGARLGGELIEAVLDGLNAPWMRAAFEVIEQALERGSPSTRTLVVVGLFEAMQGPAYRRADPLDLADAWLGAASRAAWADLIEGWTGDGIRSIEAWRRVVINGPRHRLELITPTLRLSAVLGDALSVTWQRGSAQGGRPLTTAEAARSLLPIRPLVARRLLDPSAAPSAPSPPPSRSTAPRAAPSSSSAPPPPTATAPAAASDSSPSTSTPSPPPGPGSPSRSDPRVT